MKKSIVLLATAFALVAFVTLTSFKLKDEATLEITNKTDSDIDEVHFIIGGEDSGDILGDDEIMEPGESIETDFDCEGVSSNTMITIKLVFEDGKTYSFQDNVCEGDFSWDIVDDGGHKD
jgi:hypothetical protein